MQFDGVDDFVRVPHYDALTFGTSAEFALTFWIKTTATTDSELISKRGAGAYPYNVRLLSNGAVQFSRSDGANVASVTSTVPVNNGTYHFIAVVKQGDELHIYVDADFDGMATDTTAGSTTNTETLRLGIGDATALLPFNGLLDDARIYDVTLCDTDVAAIMAEQ